MPLITTPNFDNADASYAALIASHEGLSEAESHAYNARLILILMNQIGRADIIAEAFTLARNPSGQGKRGDQHESTK